MRNHDSSSENWRGRIALMVAHCAGMVDLVALPVWMGALIARYGLPPQQAGTLVTLFLMGAVGSSLFCAPRFQRLRTRAVAAGGFAVAALAFGGVAATSDYAAMAGLHLLAGMAAGSALSVTHGTVGQSANPHRMFALCGMALGVFAIIFLGALPEIVAANGGPALFIALAIIMLAASVSSALLFPRRSARPQAAADPRAGAGAAATQPISSAVWFAALGIGCMGLVQAMMFSFLERIGADRGYSASAVTGVLIALGIVNLFPAPLAALLEKRWPARYVVLAGPVAQAFLALTISHGSTYASYAGAAAVFAAVMIFTHTFAFGLVAQLDPGGRALSATPAMLMVGAAIGPVLGGTLVQHAGYAMLGTAAMIIATIAVVCFARAGQRYTLRSLQ
ncbi:MFS transporter [Duganella sp. FT135W]|uniref:MFS transporter n=1 Tax=Duganella flavida TaxID=2692175 RepID=A0A6L8KA14_9BURK|nr:MFS transporter [Duganella flavida]MYM22674.1 MFS transporter [Duganella flavida]